MSQLTVSCNPLGCEQENEESLSVTGKSAMSSPGGNRSMLTIQRNKTPTQSGRNSIHADSASNSAEDASPTQKSQNSSGRRPLSKSAGGPASFKRPATTLGPGSLRLETQYTTKKKRYLQLKKDLLEKQKQAQDVYNDMSQLREKLITTGAKDPGKLEDVKVEVGSAKHPGEAAATKELIDSSIEKFSISNEFLTNLENLLREVPKESQNFCRELLDRQSEFASFVTSHLINTSELDTEEKTNAVVTIQLEDHQRECDNLRSRLVDLEELEMNSLSDLMKNVRDLVNGYENYKAKIKEQKAMENNKELEIQLSSTAEELQLEREKNNQNKDRIREMEFKLQKARSKIRELETHVANDDGKIEQLQAHVKNLEAQIKQKDQSMDLKLKEMQKTMKSSKGLVDKVEKQRDSLETRLVELKEKMNSKENDAMGTIKELSEKLNAVTNEVAIEREKRQQVEDAFNELEERYKNLEEKSHQLCELAEKNKDFTIIEGSHTDNEVRLYKELQEAKQELDNQRQMMLQMQQEKEEIVAVMHQAANHDEENDSRERLVTELAFKTNELQNLTMQYSEMKKVAKNAQERNGMLERQLMEIQNRLQSQLKEGGRAGLSAHAIELQQQVSDLSNNLAEVVQQKEELETALTQKQLELEQRDRVMREQSKFLKVRDELLDILKGKVQQEEGKLSNNDENNEYYEEVQRQITAKTEVIQELYTTLENKQRQIMRLEKMVKLMEDQQDRAQAQRTRFENRIAQLELAIQRSKEQRYVREKSAPPPKCRVESEQDTLSQEYYTDPEQVPLQNPYKRSNYTSRTVPLQERENDTPRQTSSDEEQPYICERCRREIEPLGQDVDVRWVNRDESDDNSPESFHDWFRNRHPPETTKHSVNDRDFRDDYLRNSPPNVKNKKYNSMTCNLHGESDNVDDSSRESYYPKECNPHHNPLCRYFWQSSNNTELRNINL